MKKILFVLVSLALLSSCVSEEIALKDAQASVTDAESAAYVPGQAYVKFSNDTTGLTDVLKACGVASVERVFTIGGKYEARQRAFGLHKWYTVTYSSELPMTKAQSDLSAIEGVEMVEPVRQIVSTGAVFNDLGKDLWGLHNTEYEGVDINVTPVWEHYTVGNPEIIVAVVDEGVDVNHPDLKANCTAKHFNYSGTAGGITAGDHGTHVAGTIAAVSNNGKGVCGIAGGNHAEGKKGVKITSYQILPAAATGNKSADAIRAAADNGALICQNSWGYNYDRDGNGQLDAAERAEASKSTISQPDKEAIDYFIACAGCDEAGNQLPDSPMKGGIVVFAAGNDSFTNAAPANYDGVIAVGAIGPDGKRADFSNYGDWVDIAAPGVNIYSTVTNNSYGFQNGTSMACPHVSGVAALVLSYYGGPGFTADMLKERILKGANYDKVNSKDKIGPLLDAYGAMTYGDDIKPGNIGDLEVSAVGNRIDFTWTQVADEGNKPVYGAMVIYGTDKAAVEAAQVKSYEGCSIFTCELDTPVGDKVEFAIKGLEFTTTYYCKVLNYTYSLNYSEATEVVAVETKANSLPEVEILHDGEIQLYSHEKKTVHLVITEPDGHDFSVAYTPGSTADELNKVASGYALTIVGNAAESGSYVGKLTVKDQYDASVTVDIPYTIKLNKAPVKIKEIEDQYLTSLEGFRFDMKDYVTDPDGEKLKYDIEIGSTQVMYLSANGDMLYGTPFESGVTDVKIAAYDSRKEQAVFEFKVLVKDPSEPVSVYPNPVTDYVNVGTLDKTEPVEIHIVSSAGKTMYRQTSEISGFEPAKVDMSAYAPGTYSVRVTYEGKEYKKTVVKL